MVISPIEQPSTEQPKPQTIDNTNEVGRDIELLLSKSIYSGDCAIVGRIRFPLSLPPSSSSTTSSKGPHNYQSLKVYAAGRCRIDPRWHDVPSLTRIYGTHPHHSDLPEGVEDTAVNCYFGRKTGRTHTSATGSTVVDKDGDSIPCVCFWSTNVITLYDQEGQECDHDGAVRVPVVKGYDHSRREPLSTEGSEWLEWAENLARHREGDSSNYSKNIPEVGRDVFIDDNVSHVESDERKDNTSRNGLSDDCEYSECSSGGGVSEHDDRMIQTSLQSCTEDLDNDQTPENCLTKTLYFTFRADLPSDLPPSANATCARYFYSVVLVAHDFDGKSTIFQAPFTVIAPPFFNQTTSPPPSQPKIRIGTIYAINHPTPHPIAISATTEIEMESSRVSVHRTNCGWGGTDNDDVRTVPLEDSGTRCCRLTIVGGKVMYPGNKILLHFDFLEDEEDRHLCNGGDRCSENRSPLLQCHQVSACLYGEEKAIGIDGVTKRRTRYNVFDTSTAGVEHGYTDSVSLTLALPLDNCPVTLATDLVEASVTCRIDVTVSDERATLRAAGSTNEGSPATGGVTAYRFLTVEFPCCVIRCPPEEKDDNDEDGLAPAVKSKIVQLLMSRGGADSENVNRNKVLNPDMLNDLTMLSLHTIETETQ